MKKSVLMVVAALAVACSGSTGTGGGAQPAAQKTLRFALIPKALDIPVFDYANKGAQRKAKELGGVEVTYRGPDHSDELKQKEVLESFISQKVDGIAISVLNAGFLSSTIDKAIDAGIPVVTWDSDAPASKRIAFYGVDDFKSGQIMGEQAAKLLNGKGTVAFITSLGANNLARRLDGAKDVLAKYPGIKIIETFDTKEDGVRCAEIIASATNRYPNLGAWISVGGWPVFTANALTPVPKTTMVISFDTNPPAPDLLKAGKVQVLLGQKYFGWGSETVQMLYDIVHGKRPANAVVDSGVDVVTKENVDQYVADWNKLAGGS
ncbi:MAG TPA: sugar-binding protein [Vicinamibacterales bacterium]|nr:sugar-binding protein [Vicinamibacterales bacterium]